jgi:hypothetical protein
MNPLLRRAIINPLPKRRGEIEVSQGRMYDPHVFGGQGNWAQPLIEWVPVLAATADEADAVAAVL